MHALYRAVCKVVLGLYSIKSMVRTPDEVSN